MRQAEVFIFAVIGMQRRAGLAVRTICPGGSPVQLLAVCVLAPTASFRR